MQSGVLVVSSSRGGSCCEAVRALCPMGRSVRAVEAKLTRADGVVFTSQLWTVGTRSPESLKRSRCGLPWNLVNPEILKQ
jgi:hypothetical protein